MQGSISPPSSLGSASALGTLPNVRGSLNVVSGNVLLSGRG